MTATTPRGYVYQQNTDPPEMWTATKALADSINADVQAVVDDRDAAWVSYSPSLTASTTNPTLGASSAVHGRYKKIGKTCHVEVYLLFSPTSMNPGSGSYAISLPLAPSSAFNASWLGSAYFRDASAGGAGHFAGFCIVSAGSSAMGLFGGTNAQVTNAAPFTWAVNDFIRAQVTYELP